MINMQKVVKDKKKVNQGNESVYSPKTRFNGLIFKMSPHPMSITL